MSGGSLDYAYTHVRNAAETLREQAETELHLRLADHLDKVAQALHDTEWVLSGDYGEGREVAAIKALLGIENEKP